MIFFNRPSVTSLEQEYVSNALTNKLSGDGAYTKKASELFKEKTGVSGLILTTSGTHALELAALLCGIELGDEVIMPSFTFSSTANAFLLRRAKIVFCDIETNMFNMDERLILRLITEKTKAIVPVHYAGVACEMDGINNLARKHGLYVIEDAAQAVGSTYRGRPCGALGDIGCYSFHESKNYCMGEGGGIVIKSAKQRELAEIIREKGTNRSGFLRGEVDKYTWRQPGSSYLPSDVLAALLCAQLTRFDEIMQSRMKVWSAYHSAFAPLESKGWQRPFVPNDRTHNAHMYYLITPDADARENFITKLKECGVHAVSHYEPLHAAPMGRTLGYRPEELPLTMDYAARLVRLPLWAGMSEEDVSKVIESVMIIGGKV
jgi:dTDP-4-amino-4,6-dideoxygalactose transaminase